MEVAGALESQQIVSEYPASLSKNTWFEPQPQNQAILFRILRISSSPPHAQDERQVDIKGTVNLFIHLVK